MDKYDRPLATLDHNPLVAYFDAEQGVPQSPKDRGDVSEMRELFALQRAGAVRLMVGLSTALEKPRPGERRKELHVLARELEALGIDRDDILTTPRTIGVSVPDQPNTVYYDVELETMLNQKIHAILFEGKTERDAKNVAFYWPAYRDGAYRRWHVTDSEAPALAELDFLRPGRYIPLSPQAPRLPPTPTVDELEPERRAGLADILQEMADDWMNTKNDALGLFNHLTHAVATSVPQHAVFVTSDRNFKQKRKWDKLKALGFPGHIMEPAEAAAYFRSLAVAGVAATGDSDLHAGDTSAAS
jgi:hypothetical protein